MAASPQPPSPEHPLQLPGAFQPPSKIVGQHKSNKKRAISPEHTDEDIATGGNSSSDSSADPDELPAKRPRRSTVVVRSSKATANLHALTTPTAIGQNSFSPSNGLIVVDTPADLTLGMQTPPSPSLWTDASSAWEFVDSDADILGETTSLQLQQGGDALFDTRTEPSRTSPDLPFDTKPIIPGFLTAKHNIYGYLVNVDEPKFKALLDNYIAFEVAEQSGIRGTLPTTCRPAAVTWWTSRARPDRIPPFDDLKEFAIGVAEWWISIQPDWRRLKRGEANRGDGCWECLYQPGINGLLNVVILVYWWAKASEGRGESGDPAYHWLVEDVTWVLSRLTHIASDGFSPE